MKSRIAIIGAGLTGLTLAQELSVIANVQVFEKARGVGGRMSTRYADPFFFDHGTQFFSARSGDFQGFLEPMIASGHVAEWRGTILDIESGKDPTENMWCEPHYVAVPHMNGLCKTLARSTTVHANIEIVPLARHTDEGWFLRAKDGKDIGVFDWVISTTPSVQTARLFGEHWHSEEFASATMLGCYALMIGFKKPWDRPWIAARIHRNVLQWIGVNSTKPGRNNIITSLVIHSAHNWAQERMDADLAVVQADMIRELQSVTGMDCRSADHLSIHKWRYATLATPRNAPNPMINSQRKLAAVGDWCSASRIEDVWLGARKFAATLMDLL